MKFFKSMFHDNGRFWRRIVSIAIPIAVQSLLNSSLNMIDSVMIGTLGETTISAVGLANKYYFIFMLLVFGISSGSAVMTAQYWGSRELANVKKVLGMSILIAVGATSVFALGGCLFPRAVMRVFTPNPATIEVGVSYLRIVAVSYPIISLTNALTASLRGINQVKVPVLISVLAIFCNVGLNYVLIFGKLGLPAMGAAGAALATVLARVIECAALIVYIYAGKSPLAATFRELVAFDKVFTGKFVHTVLPVILNEFMWGLGVTMYALVYGRMGDAATAAITITQTAEQVLQVAFTGISAATGVILGNEMGNNKLERAERYARYIIALQFMFCFVVGFLCFALRNAITGLYAISAEVVDYVHRCLYVYIFYLPFKMFNQVNITGILRSGGDTKAALILDTTGVWFWALPLAVLGGLVWKLPIYVVYAMILSEEFLKCVFGLIRYKQKKWLKNLVI
ncbi:MATE family efflux transporter [Anaerolentibacter hominis]|uniref:MATE family efflux transporter n=1 Tax=Anaerolentibacter hominis TaxID=3079009 RepID=UPI0031B88055